MKDLPGSSFMTMGAMVLVLAGSCVTRWLVVKAEVDAAKLKNGSKRARCLDTSRRFTDM
jgi:hypothetical protein